MLSGALSSYAQASAYRAQLRYHAALEERRACNERTYRAVDKMVAEYLLIECKGVKTGR